MIVILFLSPIFGGMVEAHLTFDTMVKCQALHTQLVKNQIRHRVIEDCKEK